MRAMHRLKYPACQLVLATACYSGCSGNSTTTPTTTSTLTIDFTGTLTPNGSAPYQFATLAAGQVSIELMSLSPDTTSVVGLELGVWDGTACQRVVHNDSVQVSTTVVADASTAGSLCASIYDSTGTLPRPEAFDIQAVHP
jgi:hypothetical protein